MCFLSTLLTDISEKDDTLRHTLVREAGTLPVTVSVSDVEALEKKQSVLDEALKQLTASGIPIGWKGTWLVEVFCEFIRSFPTSLVGRFITAYQPLWELRSGSMLWAVS